MKDILQMIYDKGSYWEDNWSSSLVMSETAKVHETIRTTINSMTQIIVAPNASKESKEWAKQKIEALLK